MKKNAWLTTSSHPREGIKWERGHTTAADTWNGAGPSMRNGGAVGPSTPWTSPAAVPDKKGGMGCAAARAGNEPPGASAARRVIGAGGGGAAGLRGRGGAPLGRGMGEAGGERAVGRARQPRFKCGNAANLSQGCLNWFRARVLGLNEMFQKNFSSPNTTPGFHKVHRPMCHM